MKLILFLFSKNRESFLYIDGPGQFDNMDIFARVVLAILLMHIIVASQICPSTLPTYIVLCVGGSKQKECFIYHEVTIVLYEKINGRLCFMKNKAQ